MINVIYVNFDVSSAVEYAGNIFETWIDETVNDKEVTLKIIKNQNPSWEMAKNLKKFKPDNIILNEFFERSVIPSFFYKIFFPDISIILIEHVWQRLVAEYNTEYSIEKESYESCNHIFCINHNINNDWSKCKKEVLNFYYPTDPNIFNISTSWNKREKNFLYLGNILPHKLSVEFIEKIKNTDIKIDCYGKRFNDEDKKYYTLFDSASSNLIYKGQIPQEDVAKIMNEYKYFIMPHDGFEPFNWTLLQSIFCGTIPLIVNNREQNAFNPTWIDWADSLYFGCNKVDELINNLQQIITESPDYYEMSEQINKRSQRKFNYDVFKSKFQEVLLEEIEIHKLLKEIEED